MKRIHLASVVFAIAALVVAAFASAASAAPIFSLASQYGGYGSGINEFKSPEGIDTDSKGNVWFSDHENNRVVELSPEGAWVTQITGSGGHALELPSGVATTPDGNIWVADSPKGFLAEYNAKGEYLREAVPTGCGCVWKPFGVAVDSKGNVWAIGDSTHPERIYKFNSEGKFQKYITNVNEAIMVDNSDNLWVSNVEKNRLDGYSSEGSYIGQIGEGSLPAIGDATVDTEGNFWIYSESKVKGFTAKGAYLSEFSNGHPGLGGAHVLAPALSGNLWLGLSTNGGQIQKWTAAPAAITEAATGVSTSEATLNGSVNPHGVETTYQFEYSNGIGGWAKVAGSKSAGSGTSLVKVSSIVTGLQAGLIYRFRLNATNSYGTTTGLVKSFIAGTNEWGVEATAEPSGMTSFTPAGISCVNAESCAAVGSYTASGVQSMLARVKDANGWSLTSPATPAGATLSGFSDVSCTAANACTAVGGYKTASASPTLAERWNGTSWSIQSTPNPSTPSSSLTGIACAAANDCMAVGVGTEGTTSKTLAERWNGTTWSIVSTPNVAGYEKNDLNEISCVSTSDCWAVGKSSGTGKTETALAEHWNGTAWSVNSPAGMKSLTNVSCGSASSCVATTTSGLLVVRWNGSSWSQEAALAPANILKGEGGTATASLKDVSCTSASACVATGEYLTKTEENLPLAETWNGSKWTIQSVSIPPDATVEGQTPLSVVSCVSATQCTAFGRYTTPSLSSKSLIETRF